jgi:broad specificity phosphatase PhoE
LLSEEQLIASALRIDSTYRPLLSRETLAERAAEGESTEALYERLAQTVCHLCARPRWGPLLVVGHAVTVDASARRLVGKTAAANDATLALLGHAILYCALVALRLPDDPLQSSFSYAPDPIPAAVAQSTFFRDIDVHYVNRVQ